MERIKHERQTKTKKENSKAVAILRKTCFLITLLAILISCVYKSTVPKKKTVLSDSSEIVTEFGDKSQVESQGYTEQLDSLAQLSGIGRFNRMPASVDYQSNIAYSHPDTMQMGESTTITLVIGRAELFNMEELVEDEFSEGEDVRTAMRELTRKISAELIGSNFEIDPKGDREQLMTEEKLRWNWSVKPLSCGTHTLSLIIYKYIVANGEESRIQLKALHDDIYVFVPKVPWYKCIINFIMEHFEWLFTLIVIPVIVPFRKKIAQYFKSKRS